ncbi:M23 family metallopeptidase [Nocardioides piscis]|uniref:Peptidoglycan DD-metalloendopeptidase family protein n=1 Tax=Nocardioides piscis TaxID=2714938 RepID=A0A6G7YBP5_9ACTN|nr:M23 family metallopeptidase [Nocardioides piscis]QIK74096.1 peptidoglycan DD-metalloendopeptidase family protein [Nocardioides piscis]
MRSFPRTARSRMATACVAAVVALGTAIVPLTSQPAVADDLKDRQKRVEKKVDRAHDDVEESSKALRTASARLTAARAQLSDARTALATARGKLAVAEERDAAMAAALATAEATLDQAQAELEAGRADVAAQRDVVGATIKRLYAQGDPDLMAFASLMESASASDLSRRADVNQAIVDSQDRDYDRLQAAEVILEVNEARVEAARDDVAVKRAAAADQLAVTAALEVEAQEARDSVAGLVGERASAQAEASRVRADDLRKLQRAQRDANRIEQMLRRRAARALARARAKAAASNQRSAPAGPTGGLLQVPVGGGMTSPFGYRRHPIYGYWGMHDGTDFGGGCGQTIVAAESGRVVSRYYSAVYGNRLIVDHGVLAGRGVATIYNHASSYTVASGTFVNRGQVIGYVGDTGWSTACHLHFTVMANGSAVNPVGFF